MYSFSQFFVLAGLSRVVFLPFLVMFVQLGSAEMSRKGVLTHLALGAIGLGAFLLLHAASLPPVSCQLPYSIAAGCQKMKVETASSLKAWTSKFQNISSAIGDYTVSRSQGHATFKEKGKKPHRFCKQGSEEFLAALFKGDLPHLVLNADCRVAGRQCSCGFVIRRNFCLDGPVLCLNFFTQTTA